MRLLVGLAMFAEGNGDFSKADHLDRLALGEVEGLIADLYARDGVEYLRMAAGEELRLDWLVSVDAKRRVDG